MYARVEIEDLEELADADLVRRFKLGNEEAFAVLLGRHSEALYRFCCHLVPSREDAEDICQETLTRAMTRVDSLQTGGAFRSWLFSIARNLSIDSFRSKKRICPLPDEDVTPLPQHESSPHERVEAGEERETVAVALSKLRRSHQRVLMLREVEGLSYADIARELDVSQSAVETLLFRARRRLREEYSKREMPTGGVAIAAGLRAVIGRLAAPLAGGSPFAAKVTITTALLAGTAAAVPVAVPHNSRLLVNHRKTAHHASATTDAAARRPAIQQSGLAAPTLHRPVAAQRSPTRVGSVTRHKYSRSISHGRTAVLSSRPNPRRHVSVRSAHPVQLTNQTVRRHSVHSAATAGSHTTLAVTGSTHQLSAQPQPAAVQSSPAGSTALPASRPWTSITSVQAPVLGSQKPVSRHARPVKHPVGAAPSGRPLGPHGRAGAQARPLPGHGLTDNPQALRRQAARGLQARPVSSHAVGKSPTPKSSGAKNPHANKHGTAPISAPQQSAQSLPPASPVHSHGAGQGARASGSLAPDTATTEQSKHGHGSHNAVAAGASPTSNPPQAHGHSSADHAGSHGSAGVHNGAPAATVPSGQPASLPAAPVTTASAPAVAAATPIPAQGQVPPGQAKKNAASSAPAPIQNTAPQTGPVNTVPQTQSQPTSAATTSGPGVNTPPGQEKKQGKSHP